MIGTPGIASKAAELRSVFDRTFALPPPAQGEEAFDNLIGIRVAGNPYAVRLREISGLVNNRKIAPFPSPIPEFLGIASARRGLIPVYSLASLLGYAANGDAQGWMLLCGLEDPVGLSFPEFESYLRVSPSNIHATRGGEGLRDHVTEVVRAGAAVRAVVSIPSIVQAIKERIGAGRPPKER